MTIQRITATIKFKDKLISEPQDWSYSASSDQSDHGHSGIATATGVFYDRKKITVNITSTDTSQIKETEFQQGAAGILIVTSQDRPSPDGIGLARTYTFAEASLDSVSPSVGTGGISALTFTFTCVSSTGDAIVAYSQAE